MSSLGEKLASRWTRKLIAPGCWWLHSSERRLGETILLEALEEAYRIVQYSGMGIAVVTDPPTVESDRFFKRYGFISMKRSFGSLDSLYLPMKTIGRLLNET